MSNHLLILLFSIYGAFLICSGITAILYIGAKAKTAIMSGGTSGSLFIGLAFLLSNNFQPAQFIGLGFTVFLLGIFSWRTTKTLFSLFDMIQNKDEGLKGKGIAFLIIGQMAVVTMLNLFAQLILLF